MKYLIYILIFVFSSNTFATYNKSLLKKEDKFELSPEVHKAMNQLNESIRKMYDYIESRIKELKSIKERNLQQEQELNALELIYEGDMDKINNYIKVREKIKENPNLFKPTLMD